MDVRAINEHLQSGILDAPGLFPHLERLRQGGPIFQIDFGLTTLPKEAGAKAKPSLVSLAASVARFIELGLKFTIVD